MFGGNEYVYLGESNNVVMGINEYKCAGCSLKSTNNGIACNNCIHNKNKEYYYKQAVQQKGRVR